MTAPTLIIGYRYLQIKNIRIWNVGINIGIFLLGNGCKVKLLTIMRPTTKAIINPILITNCKLINFGSMITIVKIVKKKTKNGTNPLTAPEISN